MLSYQHGYHAGGPADIHKHLVLAGMLRLLTRKPRPISYMESHAGRGLYDLEAEQARKTGEWRAGLGRVALGDHPLAEALARVRGAHGPMAYPGSPLIARTLLREIDRMVLMELHPVEHAILKRAFARPCAEIHRRDGCEGVLALSPPQPRRGLVLVDPSYERKSEYGEIAQFVAALARKWPEAAIIVWYPILPAGRHTEVIAGLAELAPRDHRIAFPPHRGRAEAMTGSGVLIHNAPYGTDDILVEVDRLCLSLGSEK